MLRDRDVSEIYDGRYYTPDDLVPIGCGDCEGCSECCRSTGDSIVLDPYDLYMLRLGTGKDFEDMIEREIEIRLVDGLILPNLMQHREDGSPGEDHCAFLSAEGRCTIHPYRPGICRLYPMGRYYTGNEFRYILQKDECTERKKTPVLLREWLGISDLPGYESYILDWHGFKKKAQAGMLRLTPRSRDSVARYILQVFFVHPYLEQMGFYPQYEARREVCNEALREIF